MQRIDPCRRVPQIAIIVWLLVGAGVVASPRVVRVDGLPDWANTPPKIEGNQRFVEQVGSAMKLMKDKTPRVYDLIQKNVAIVKQGKRSGMWAFRDPPTFEMADPTAFYSITWCAGSIAHDAFHSKLYRDYLDAKGRPVPNAVWTGREAELKCLSFQLDVLEKVGASRREIEHCRAQNGEHFDIDKDGNYEWSDYFQRNW
ncbi:MAG: hypothetical protein AAFU85_30000 [Planctomycetota bacterium]